MTQTIDLKELSEYDDDGIFRPEKLVLVHVTNYMPSQVGNHYEIQSTAEATDYSFDKAWEKIQEKMKKFDQPKDSSLTRRLDEASETKTTRTKAAKRDKKNKRACECPA